MPRIRWTGADGVARHGEVWSPGPMDTSVWVIPDEPCEGEGRAVCVGLDGRQTAIQAEWSRQEHQDLVALALPERSDRPDLTARGGQLRARITPRVAVPAYPEMTVQPIHDRPLIDVHLPEPSREDTP